jgi:hypothetical protein
MIKPYEITGESRYIGLPLGFGFLGATYVLSAFAYYMDSPTPNTFDRNMFYIQLIARTFAFLFIAITYYFSKKPTKNSQVLWKTTLTLLITLFIISFIIIGIPHIDIQTYDMTRNCLRVINLIIILYICIHTFRSHIEKPDSTTIWIPLGYICLAISQYSVLIWQLDESLTAFFGGAAFRLIFLSVILVISFATFYKTEKEGER